jgi:bacterioferritin
MRKRPWIFISFTRAVTDASIYLEEFARTMISQEEMHGLEMRKMLRDFSGL